MSEKHAELTEIESLKKENEELKNRLNILENSLDSLPVGIFFKDAEGRYKFVNKLFSSDSGLDKSYILNKTDLELWQSPDIAKNYIESDKILREKKLPIRTLAPYIRDDTVMFNELIKAPILDESNELKSMAGLILHPNIKNDINVNAEVKNHKNIILFDFDMNSDIVAIYNTDAEFNCFSSRKISLEDFITAGLVHENDYNNVRLIFDLLKQGKQLINLVLKIYDNKHETHIAKMSLNCAYDVRRNPIKVAGSIYLIDESEKNESLLQMDVEIGRNQLDDILAAPLDLCLYLNPNLDFYHIYFATGMTKQLQKEGKWTDFVDTMFKNLHPSDFGILKSLFSSFEERKPDDPPVNTEFRFLGESGEYRWKSFATYPLNSSKNGGFIIDFVDIDEAIKLRNQKTLRDLNGELIEALSNMVEFRDMESGEHIKRIKNFTRILLSQVNKISDNHHYTKEQINVISTASAMHDIGKIAISDAILTKPGKLTDEEYNQMKLHTLKGCEILKTMPKIQNEDYYNYCYEICRHHHERYDGRGYPDGLKGDEIPIESQIVALADVYDALTSERCYKKAYSHEKAYNMIINGECGVFSPLMLECLTAGRKEMEELK